ncbi:MAG: hypothetical protein WBD38_00600 [Candidatus Dormiibacterota bacterium]
MINMNQLERDIHDRQTVRCVPTARPSRMRSLRRRRRAIAPVRPAATRLAVGLRTLADRLESLADAA